VVEFSDAEIEKRQHRVAKENGFTLESHNMMLYGICPKCSAAKKG
jgi:Fur family ferric uptake transcriptional regulator